MPYEVPVKSGAIVVFMTEKAYRSNSETYGGSGEFSYKVRMGVGSLSLVAEEREFVYLHPIPVVSAFLMTALLLCCLARCCCRKGSDLDLDSNLEK